MLIYSIQGMEIKHTARTHGVIDIVAGEWDCIVLPSAVIMPAFFSGRNVPTFIAKKTSTNRILLGGLKKRKADIDIGYSAKTVNVMIGMLSLALIDVHSRMVLFGT